MIRSNDRRVDQRYDNMNKFDSGGVAALVSLVSENQRSLLKKAIFDSIGEQLDEVFKLLPRSGREEEGTLLRTGIDNVAMRVQTFVAIVEALAGNLSQAQIDKAMFDSGLCAGLGFAEDIFDHFLENKSLPKDYEAFLDFWCKYDSSAGFGILSLELCDLQDNGMITVGMKNSFVVRGLRERTHRYCKFVEGYMRGLLYDCLQRCCRTLHVANYRAPSPILYPNKSTHKRIDDRTCAFTFTLATEELDAAHEELFWAKEALRVERYREAILQARGAMELAIRQKLDVPEKEFPSFHRMMAALSDEECKVRVDKLLVSVRVVRDTYGVASNFAHGTKKVPDEDVCRDVLHVAQLFLFCLDHLKLREAQKNCIKKVLAKGPQSGKERSEDRKHLEVLLKKTKRRLAELEKKSAIYGIDVPPHVPIEIEDLKAKIDDFAKKIEKLRD